MKKIPEIKWTTKNHKSILAAYRVLDGKAYYSSLKEGLEWTTDKPNGLYTPEDTITTIHSGYYTAKPSAWDGGYLHAFDIDQSMRTHLKALVPYVHVSRDDTRYFIKGIYLDGPAGKAVATDGRGMAVFDIPSSDTPSVIVRPTAQFIICLRLADRLMINKDGRSICLEGDGWTSYHETIDAQFPNYARVIPDRASLTKWFRVPDAETIKSIQEALKYYKQTKANRVHFTPSGRIVIGDIDGYKELGKILPAPSDLVILSNKYLLPVAGQVLRYKNNKGPMVSDIGDSKGFFVIIMPMREDDGLEEAIEKALA